MLYSHIYIYISQDNMYIHMYRHVFVIGFIDAKSEDSSGPGHMGLKRRILPT